jgi:hypothetical protein
MGCAKICAENRLDESCDGHHFAVGTSCGRLECLVAVHDFDRSNWTVTAAVDLDIRLVTQPFLIDK